MFHFPRVCRIVMALYFVLATLSCPCSAATKHPSEEEGLKSKTGDVAARITFVNKSGRDIRVYWLNYEGKRILYASLKDGESYNVDTYLTHPWLITDQEDNAWHVHMPKEQPQRIEITAPAK